LLDDVRSACEGAERDADHANDGAALVVAFLIQGRRRIRVSKASKAASPEAAFFVRTIGRTREEGRGESR